MCACGVVRKAVRIVSSIRQGGNWSCGGGEGRGEDIVVGGMGGGGDVDVVA